MEAAASIVVVGFVCCPAICQNADCMALCWHNRTLLRTARLQAEHASNCGRTAEESRDGRGGRKTQLPAC